MEYIKQIHDFSVKWCDKLAVDESEKTLARAYADAHNKVGWLMHDLDDEDCPLEIKQQYEAWSLLEAELRTRIIDILKRENIVAYEQTVAENKGYYNVVKPFMLRNGYRDGSGWWVENNSSSK